MSKKILFTEEQMQNIYQMYYIEKLGLKSIQEKYNISQSVLTRIFKENNWKCRTRHENLAKYELDEYYFDSIDTSDKAYCLGLLYADGCNHVESNTIDIELQSQDIFVLEKMNELIQNTRPIRYYSSVNSKNRKKDTCKLMFRSKHTSEQLEKWGMVARKSLSLTFPDWLTDDVFPAFLRGYIDGDGWIQKYRIGLMSTDSFCYGVKEFLFKRYGIECHVMDMKRHYNKKTKTLYICNRKNLLPLTNMMFKDCNIFIPRKLDKYYEFGFLDKITYNSIIA